MTRTYKKTLLPALLLAMGSLNCGRNNDANLSDLSDDNPTWMVDSALGTLSGALNEMEQNPGLLTARPTGWMEFLIPTAWAAPCGIGIFTPSLGSASCAGTEGDQTVTHTYALCTAGAASQFTLNGSMKLYFDSPTTCAAWVANTTLPTSGSVTRAIPASFIRTNSNKTRVQTDSEAHQNYLNVQHGGGIRTTFNGTNRTIDILGIHRTRTRDDGTAGFDHSIYSTQSLVITGSRATNNRRISQGKVRVDHNRLRLSVESSVTGLTWDSSCCYPTSGALTFSMVSPKTGTVSVEFQTSCGLVQVLTKGSVNASYRVQLQGCE